MNRRFTILSLLLIFGGALIGGVFGRLQPSASVDGAISIRSVSQEFEAAIGVIDQNYIGVIEREEILDFSIQRMLWTLDPHSSFFTKREFQKLAEEQQSEFYGIGVSINQRSDGVYVQSVVPETPADKGGLRFGDKFVEVDGEVAKEWTAAEVSKKVRGKRGEPVKIKVARAGAEKEFDFEIVRGGVPLPSIRNYFMLKGDIGYVGLSGGFQQTTTTELDTAIADLGKEGMKSLVLDLRGNPGGLLPQAIEVVSRFVPEGQKIVSVKGRSQFAKSRELIAEGDNHHDFPLVVLINGGSASASEIVAGALQDHGRGLVVGSESFGKGLVQKLFPLPYGTAMTLTTARYYTPYGRSLQRDYSKGSIYEYFTHSTGDANDLDTYTLQADKPMPIGEGIITAGGRTFFGGQGIKPDLNVPPLKYDRLRFRIAESAFFFVRELVAGKVSGFGSFKTDKQNFKRTISVEDISIETDLFDAFLAFVETNEKDGLTAANIKTRIRFAKSKIREQLAIARYSGEAGMQVLLESDPQVLMAMDAIPQAEELLGTILAEVH